jgi:ketosteroid isomerase-like protein
MQKIATVIALAVFACGAASASDKTDAMAVVHKWADAFNKGDGKTGASYCAADALIIDDFAPHVGKTRHLDIDSGYAYLVTPTTLTFTKAGKPVTDHATVTMTLKKGSSGWQITGWAWADQ